MEITLNTPLTQFPGVGEVRAKKLEKLGLVRCADLLAYFPRDYEDRRQVYAIRSAPLGQKVCISALAAEHPRLSRIRRGLDLVQVKVVDQAGALHLTFFNQSYVERSIRAGEEYIFYGVVEEQGRRRTMVNPIFERVGKQNFTGGDHQPSALLPRPPGGGRLCQRDARDPAPGGAPGPPAGPGGVLLPQHPLSRLL